MSETTRAPGRRGTKPGTKQERNFEHSCPQCGVTFMGTARAVFCSRACNLRSWRARQPKAEVAYTADEISAEIAQADEEAADALAERLA